MGTQRPQPQHLLVLLAFCTFLALTTASNDGDTDFIRKSCKTTLYSDLCFNSLSRYAKSIKQDQGKLVRIALSVSLSEVQNSITNLTHMSTSGSDSRVKAALSDCFTNLNDAVVGLRSSLKQMDQLGNADAGTFVFQMKSVHTWMSTVMTNEESCTDGLEDIADEVPLKKDAWTVVNNVKRISSVAVAIVRDYADKGRP